MAMLKCKHCDAEYSTYPELERHVTETWDHLHARLSESEAEVERVRALINRDRTGLAAAIDAMVKEAIGRLWVTEGRGPYAYDDEEYRQEAGRALRAIIEIGKKALNDSGALADSAFHPDRALSVRTADEKPK